MMELSPQGAPIQAALKALPLQPALHQKLLLAYKNLTSSTGRVAEAIGITEAQLRNWETLGILAPARSLSGGEPSPRNPSDHPGQRKYGLRDIIRALLIHELVGKGYSLLEIGESFRKDPHLVEMVIEEILPLWEGSPEQHGGIRDRISLAEKALFWRAFVPRAIYLALRLLFDRASGGEVGIVLQIPGEGAPPKRTKAEKIEELSDLGEVLIGWHSVTHPFCIFPIHRVSQAFIDSIKDYSLLSLDWAGEQALPVLSVHLLIHPDLMPLIKPQDAAVHTAAGRLLGFLQKKSSDWRAYLQLTGDYMSYNSPGFIDPNVGDQLMNHVADALVELGGEKPGRPDKPTPRWRFATIFLPRDSQQPLQQRDLVVWAHSSNSPHQIGLTNHAVGHLTGISILAYQSGQIIYRPHLADGEWDIGTRSIEEPVNSAIAIPIGGEFGHPLGVIYLASDEEDAFTPKSEKILLRMMERILGEIIMNYQARRLIGGRLPEAIAHPEIVDTYFGEFETNDTFTRTLEALLEQIHQGMHGFQHLSFIAVNIDRAISIAGRYGEWAERSLIRAIGLRIREWANNQNELLEAQLYYAYADRFFLVLRDVPLSAAGEYAERLYEALKGISYLVEATRISRHTPDYKLSLGGITTHLGVTGYTYEKLREILTKDPNPANVRARLTLALEEALRLGRDERGDTVVVWQPKSERFICTLRGEKKAPSTDFEMPAFYEQRIRQIVDEMLDKRQGQR